MIITKGFLAGRIITQGYGPVVTTPLSQVDGTVVSKTKRGYTSLTRSKGVTLTSKRTVEGK